MTGRPPVFNSPEEMEAAVDDYVSRTPPNEITITGLCIALGFVSRQSFYDYEKRDGFSYTVLKARLLVENSYERTLRTVAAPGSIFALKNMGWKDKQETELTGELAIKQITGIEIK